MCRLSEKYAPATLSEVVGQGEAVRVLEAFSRRPDRAGFLLRGSGGIGKSGAIAALLADLGAEELAVHRVSGSELTIDECKRLFDRVFRLRPMFGTWHVLVIEEFEGCPSKAVRSYLKDRLGEGQWPSRLIVLISSNDTTGIDPALLERFQILDLRSDKELGFLVFPRLRAIWEREAAERDVPSRVRPWNGSPIVEGGLWKDEEGQERYSIRRALSAMERLLVQYTPAV